MSNKNISQKQSIPKAICDGRIPIGGDNLDCAVLEDETRVISQRKIYEFALLSSGGAKKTADEENKKIPRFLHSNNLKPYVSKELIEGEHIVEYAPTHGGRSAYGIKAEALPMMCDVYINAAAANALSESQQEIAKRFRILQSGLARVGVVALVDEATGYQDIRAKNILAKILERYLAGEIQKWMLTFPLEFYEEIYRLKGWEWEELRNGKKPKTPRVVGQYTDNLVYKRLAPGILDELRSRNPKREVRHHQWFNNEHGHPKLREHIAGVIAVMKLSDSWDALKKNISKVYPLQWRKGELFYKSSPGEGNSLAKLPKEGK